MRAPLQQQIDRVEWSQYARFKREAMFLFFSSLPALGPLFLLLDWSRPAWLIAALYLSRYLWVEYRLKHWPCPRCRQPFFSGRSGFCFRDLFSELRCQHCNLPEYIQHLPDRADSAASG